MRLARKEYATQEEKKRDFWRGFWLWWAINVVMSVIYGLALYTIQPWGGTMTTGAREAAAILPMLAFVVNIGLVIYLAMTRSQMALGVLVAFSVAGGIVFIVLPLVATVACFVLMVSSSG